MTTHTFRFSSRDDFSDAELTLKLAMLSVKGIYTDELVRYLVHVLVRPDERSICIQNKNQVSTILIRIFMRMIHEEFGYQAIQHDHSYTVSGFGRNATRRES